MLTKKAVTDYYDKVLLNFPEYLSNLMIMFLLNSTYLKLFF